MSECELCGEEFEPEDDGQTDCPRCLDYDDEGGDPSEGYGADSEYNSDVLPGC
jgi:hypothetical protein